LLAKIASDLNKPDGMCRIGSDNVREILDGLAVEKLSGVGPKTKLAVYAAGIRTCGELRDASDSVLWRLFGRHAQAMRDRAAGLDDRPVEPNREEKSISAETTFAEDIRGAAPLTVQLLRLADRAAARLRAHELLAGTVSIKVRRADFTTYTRQRALGRPTQDSGVVATAAKSLLGQWLVAQPNAAVRLLGVGVSNLQLSAQGDLFGNGLAPGLDSAVDGIHDRFGSRSLMRASLLPRPPGAETGS
jgi:DNA polymerase-4